MAKGGADSFLSLPGSGPLRPVIRYNEWTTFLARKIPICY
jgi:hypothetical protein